MEDPMLAYTERAVKDAKWLTAEERVDVLAAVGDWRLAAQQREALAEAVQTAETKLRQKDAEIVRYRRKVMAKLEHLKQGKGIMITQAEDKGQ